MATCLLLFGVIFGACASPAPDVANDFWSAMSHAGKIAVLESGNRGGTLEITSWVPDIPFTGRQPDFPAWLTCRVRIPGLYLLPLRQKNAEYVVPDKNYELPRIAASELPQYADIITDYRKTTPEQEPAFLKKLLLNNRLAALHLACLLRLESLGEFREPLDKKARRYWQEVFLDGKRPTQFRSRLLAMLARVNFLPDNPVFVEALKDPELADQAAEIFYRADRKRFEALLTQWLNDPALRTCSLRHSSLLIASPGYLNAALQYFDPKKQDNLELYLPLLCFSDKTQHQKLVREFLTGSVVPAAYPRYYAIVKLLCRSGRIAVYAGELKTFLQHNQKQPQVSDSILYPALLAGLCKVGDPEGHRLALAYLDSLKTDSPNPADAARTRMFLAAFKDCYNVGLNTPEEYRQFFLNKTAMATKTPK